MKGYGIVAGLVLAGAYYSAPIMAQVHKLIPSLRPAKK